jgi:hypothetical protein
LALTEEEKAERKHKYQKQYRADNAEKIAMRSKRYYADNLERIQEQRKRWQAENSEVMASRRKRYYEDNIEIISEKQKIRYAKNVDRNRARSRGYYAKNKEKRLKYSKEYSVKNSQKLRQYRIDNPLLSVKTRAKKSGVKFDLDMDWYNEQLARGKCSVTGIKFSDRYSGKSPNTPSFDRIIAGEDYSKNNTQLVIWHYNLAKHNYTHEQFMKMVYALHPAKTWQFKINKFRAKRFNVLGNSISSRRTSLRNLFYKARQEASIDRGLASRTGSPCQN